MKPPVRFDDYCAYIVDYPHDHEVRFEKTPEGRALVAGLTAYDRFLLQSFSICFAPFVQESGMTPYMVRMMGFTSEVHLIGAMRAYQRLAVAWGEVQRARMEKSVRDRQ